MSGVFIQFLKDISNLLEQVTSRIAINLKPTFNMINIIMSLKTINAALLPASSCKLFSKRHHDIIDAEHKLSIRYLLLMRLCTLFMFVQSNDSEI